MHPDRFLKVSYRDRNSACSEAPSQFVVRTSRFTRHPDPRPTRQRNFGNRRLVPGDHADHRIEVRPLMKRKYRVQVGTSQSPSRAPHHPFVSSETRSRHSEFICGRTEDIAMVRRRTVDSGWSASHRVPETITSLRCSAAHSATGPEHEGQLCPVVVSVPDLSGDGRDTVRSTRPSRSSRRRVNVSKRCEIPTPGSPPG